MPLWSGDGNACVKADVRIAGYERVGSESMVLECIRDDQSQLLADGVSAKCELAGCFANAQPHSRLKPLAVFVNEGDERNWHITNEPGEPGEIVEVVFWWGIEDAGAMKRMKADVLICGKRSAHVTFLNWNQKERSCGLYKYGTTQAGDWIGATGKKSHSMERSWIWSVL
jgi:hypothetical protein